MVLDYVFKNYIACRFSSVGEKLAIVMLIDLLCHLFVNEMRK